MLLADQKVYISETADNPDVYYDDEVRVRTLAEKLAILQCKQLCPTAKDGCPNVPFKKCTPNFEWRYPYCDQLTCVVYKLRNAILCYNIGR